MTVIVPFLIFFAVVIVAVVILNRPWCKQLLVKFRGRTDEIMRQDASTPEGAKDYYNVAIREKEEFYNRASATYAEISGKRDSAEKDLYQTNKEIMRITQQLNACIDANDDTSAISYANKKVTLETKANVLKETIAEMKEAEKHQKEVRDQAAIDLQKLKEEKEQVVFELEANQQIIELHQSMDSVAVTSESERMLEHVREGAKKTREKARGSKIAYETSAQTADNRLKAAEQTREAQRIVDELKRQRGK